MTPEQRQQIENQIQTDFSELQKKLDDLKNEVQSEADDSVKQEKNEEIQNLESELSEVKVLIDKLKDLHEQDLESLKTRLESFKTATQDFKWEVVDLQNEKSPTPSTYELLKDSETYHRLLNIISSNPKEFKNLPWDSAEKKLEYIFTKIRNSIVLFMKNKLWDSERYDEVINDTITPAFEWSLMEMLRDQWNEANVSMLKWIDKISWDSFSKLLNWVWNFSKKMSWSYNKFSQWMNAIDYLSVHNWVLRNPEKSAVLTNPLKFQWYINNSKFIDATFSPYNLIDWNIFEISDEENFEFGISLTEKHEVLSKIWQIQVVNNPKTTALIAGMLDKPEQFLQKTQWLQKTANSLLDWVNSINSVTKIFWVDILWEITKAPENRSFWYRIMDFVCKLIWITWWLEWIVKRWCLDRMNLTDEKNDNISQIFKKYKELAWENLSLSITDENSCKSALSDFAVTDLKNDSTTKWDFLRDSIADNVDVSLVSPAVVQQILWDSYLKKEIVTEKWKSKEVLVVDESKFTDIDKKVLAHNHLKLMKDHLEKYNDNELSDFYTNIKSTEDISLCITASLYASKDDVIEWVKAKVFLPENYGSVRADWTVRESTPSSDGLDLSKENSPYKLSPWEYPFKDVPPYKNIKAYDLRNVKVTPVLDYSELNKKHEWVTKLDGSNIKNTWNEYPENQTIGNRSNNPCDISHSDFDIWYVNYNTVADGQKLARYDTPVNGIASAMRLLRNKYSNKSITEINVWWYQWYFKANEEIWLSALRLKRITSQCKALNVGPHVMLDLNDPMTLKAFVAQVAVIETWTHIGAELLDEAYKKAFETA